MCYAITLASRRLHRRRILLTSLAGRSDTVLRGAPASAMLCRVKPVWAQGWRGTTVNRCSAAVAMVIASVALLPTWLANSTAAAIRTAAASPAAASSLARGNWPAYTAAPAARWHLAREVPGMDALNKGGIAATTSVSCASAGNCGAGGSYRDGSDHFQAFVVSQRNGHWGAAKQVPGTAVLNKGGNAATTSVSCTSAGSCSAGGFYRGASGRLQALVVSEKNGTWRAAKQVPGSGMLNSGGEAETLSVSCASPGNCSAGGYFTGGSGHRQAFVAAQRRGAWGRAMEVPGTGALNKGGSAETLTISCASAGNCSAGGFYAVASGRIQAFVVSQRNGLWGKAKEVPGTAAMNRGGNARILSVSCASAGNCSAGGSYVGTSGRFQAFVVSQRNGLWGTAKQVPGTGPLNIGGQAETLSVSCASAGNCGAGGFYEDAFSHTQAFAVSQRGGTWGKAKEIPGTGALNKGGHAGALSVSCTTADTCSAGGTYTDGAGHNQAFVASRS
jgi:hypothetical protein